MYRILTEFKVFMYWKDPPRAKRDAAPYIGNKGEIKAIKGDKHKTKTQLCFRFYSPYDTSLIKIGT